MTPAAQYVCTQCHYVGQGKMAGSSYLELLMWVFLTPIAIWYSLSRSKHRHSDCPSCRASKTMIPTASPRGQELAHRALNPEKPSLTPANTAQTAAGAVSDGEKGSNAFFWVMVSLGCLLIIPITVSFSLTPPAPSAVPPAAVRPIDREAMRTAFEANRDAQLSELKAIISRQDFRLAGQRINLLQGVQSTELDKLREQILAGQAREAQRRGREQQAAAARVQAQQAQLTKALAACKRAIADAVGATGAAQIPNSANHANDIDPDEFYFAWPRGTFRLETALGNVSMSASCIGSLRRTKVMQLTVNGRDILINGRRVGN